MTRNQQLKWWQEARFGLFIHWGIYSIPGRGEWVMYNERIPVRDYEKLASQFNPAKFNADEWVRLAKDAGMKYIVITAKHHDGFSMFDTKISDFSITKATPFRRDVLKELAEACLKEDMKLGFYYSHVREWRHPMAQSFEAQGRPDRLGNYGNYWDYPNENIKNPDAFIDEFVIPQLKELLTGYGDVLTIWFDTPSQIRPDQAERIKKIVRKYQPACLINSRLSCDIETDYASMGDNEIPLAGCARPWETAMTTMNAWGYQKNAAFGKWEDMLEHLVDIASKGGNLLLNVGPDAEGVIPAPAQKELRKIGQWLAVNGKALYGTEKSPFHTVPDWGRITCKGKKLYLIVTDALASSISLTGLRTEAVKCKYLATGKALYMEQTHDAENDRHLLKIKLTGGAERFRVVQIDLAGDVDVSDKLVPAENGQIQLPVTRGEVLNISGGHGLRISPLGATEHWTDLRDCLRFTFYADRPGKYKVEMTIKTGFWKLWDWEHELSIEIDRQMLGMTVSDDGRKRTRYEERTLPVGEVWLTGGRHTLTIVPESLTSDEMTGLVLIRLTLTQIT